MAYIDEFGNVVACSTSFKDQVIHFFSSWYITILPLALLVGIFFLIKKYVKNKIILIIYSIIAVFVYLYLVNITKLTCA